MRPVVLLIDSDLDVVDRTREMFAAAGIEVATAWTFQHVHAAMEERRPAAVIIEPTLPGIDGFELCRAILDVYRDPTPAIWIASRELRGEVFRDKARRVGARGFFKRPEEDPRLRDEVSQAVTGDTPAAMNAARRGAGNGSDDAARPQANEGGAPAGASRDHRAAAAGAGARPTRIVLSLAAAVLVLAGAAAVWRYAAPQAPDRRDDSRGPTQAESRRRALLPTPVASPGWQSTERRSAIPASGELQDSEPGPVADSATDGVTRARPTSRTDPDAADEAVADSAMRASLAVAGPASPAAPLHPANTAPESGPAIASERPRPPHDSDPRTEAAVEAVPPTPGPGSETRAASNPAIPATLNSGTAPNPADREPGPDASHSVSTSLPAVGASTPAVSVSPPPDPSSPIAGIDRGLRIDQPAVGVKDVPRVANAPAPVALSGSPPRLISRVEPEYPGVARRYRSGGEVVLQATVGIDGSLREITIAEEPGARYGFGRAAVRAVQRWRYEPARLGERAVEAPITIRISFSPR